MEKHPILKHYKEITVSRLSDNQKRNLIKGKGVRVKHGQGETIHVSKDQYKKIMNAHKKNKAHTLTFDPCQQEIHGGSIGSWFRKAGKTIKGGFQRAGSWIKDNAVKALPVLKEISKVVRGPIVDALKDVVTKIPQLQAISPAIVAGLNEANNQASKNGFGVKKKRGRKSKGGALFLPEGGSLF